MDYFTKERLLELVQLYIHDLGQLKDCYPKHDLFGAVGLLDFIYTEYSVSCCEFEDELKKLKDAIERKVHYPNVEWLRSVFKSEEDVIDIVDNEKWFTLNYKNKLSVL